MACKDYLPLVLIALLLTSTASAQGLVERAEAADLPRSNGTATPRVTRDDQGNVKRLLLTAMELSPADFEELAGLEHLRALVLNQTNVTDDDLAYFKCCPKLDHINLCSTEVTDRAIDTILELKHLESLCLGNVKITPAAIERLKEHNRTSDQRLRWGYAQRKE